MYGPEALYTAIPPRIAEEKIHIPVEQAERKNLPRAWWIDRDGKK
jgi:uncharacterized membrane protein